VYNINMLECDKTKIKVIFYSLLTAAKQMDAFDVVVPAEPNVDVTTANNGHEARGKKRRRAGRESARTHCQARINVGDMLPSSSKLQRSFKVASSHLDYQEVLKVEASAAAVIFKVVKESTAVGETPSINKAVKGFEQLLRREVARSLDPHVGPILKRPSTPTLSGSFPKSQVVVRCSFT
jgi:hypothetical protein